MGRESHCIKEQMSGILIALVSVGGNTCSALKVIKPDREENSEPPAAETERLGSNTTWRYERMEGRKRNCLRSVYLLERIWSGIHYTRIGNAILNGEGK
jgi:hypothetical protein